MKNVEKREKICYSIEVTENSFVDIGRKMVMTSVIANGITDKNKLSKLNEFVKKHDAVIKNEGQPNMYVECKDLKTAKEISKIITGLK